MKLTPKEFAEKYLTEKDTWSAASASWNVTDAAFAITTLVSILRSEAYQEESDDTRQILGILSELSGFLDGEVQELYGELSKPMVAYKEAKSQLVINKDAKEKLRWVLFTSSAFEDKDGEIISEKALQKDCDQMELTGDYGELLFWHCDGDLHANLGEKEKRPYIPLGPCDFSAVSSKINIESGTFYDEEVGQIILEKSNKLGASKSFWHDEPEDNVFHSIRTKERSIMFRPKESNFLTRLFNGSK